MIVSAATNEIGPQLETDLVVIGAGAAGITIAKRLAGTSLRVIVVESGGREADDFTQSLYQGAIAGQSTVPLDASRLRFFGGTTNHWAGWCRPLEARDFQPRSDWPESGWPIARSDLDPYYAEAANLCQLGPIAFDDLEYWQRQPGGESIAPLPFDSRLLRTSIFEISPPTRFGQAYGADLDAARNVNVILDATALELLPAAGNTADQTRKTIGSVRVTTRDSKVFTISARAFVVAIGGIETARLLLLSDKVHPAGAGNENDLVGRYFMDHPWMTEAAYVRFNMDGYEAPLYFDEAHLTSGHILGAVVPTQDLIEREKIGAFRLVLRPSRISTAGADSVRALASDLRRGVIPGDLGEHLSNIFADIDVLADSAYKTITGSRKGWLGGDDTGPYKGAFVDLNFEQHPNRDSRVRLDDALDAFGQRRVRLEWRLDATDRRTADRALDIAAHEFGRIGLGRTRIRLDLGENSAWPSEVTGSNHHSGTARMSDSASTGVVDANCRVHSTENLYIAGSAVFPTTGYANPTMTIVALASRLADHLKGVLV